ncbi:MAG: alkaline phosphatase D family protein [Catalinimonas sp.]
MPTLTVGPVIGKVTATTARVLVEVDTEAEVTLTLRSDASAPHRITQRLPADRPQVFSFENLRPAATYDLRVEGAAGSPPARVRTPAVHPERFTHGVVSCNQPQHRDGTDLWQTLYDNFVRPDGLDALFHVGDQVYADGVYEWCYRKYCRSNGGSRALAETCRAAYRDVYRRTWQHPGTRAVLANVPNLMIWDDHEVHDGWSYQPERRADDVPARFVRRQARRVYREYQRQLWDAQPLTDTGGFEHHHHTWGEVGALFVDQRGGRTFHYDPEYPFLGKQQWEDLDAALGPGGTYESVRALVVVTTVPLAFIAAELQPLARRFADDLQDHWSGPEQRRDQTRLIRLLRAWKAQGAREVFVVGGDVHTGGHSRIVLDGEEVCRQLVSSPITHPPMSPLFYCLLQGAFLGQRVLPFNKRFRHGLFRRRRNFGVVQWSLPPGRTPRAQAGLVFAER